MRRRGGDTDVILFRREGGFAAGEGDRRWGGGVVGGMGSPQGVVEVSLSMDGGRNTDGINGGMSPGGLGGWSGGGLRWGGDPSSAPSRRRRQ